MYSGTNLANAEQRSTVPSPNGQKGNPDHQKAVGQLADLARDEFPGARYEVFRGTSIRQYTGINRRPDVWVFDSFTKTVKKVYEAARTNLNGTFVSRERLKQVEYDAKGIANQFKNVGGE